MHWIKIFLFKLTVLQNVAHINGKLSPENSSKSSEMLSNNLSPYSQNLVYHGHSQNGNDLNFIELQLTSADGHDDVEADDNTGIQSSHNERRTGSERRVAAEQKYTKDVVKDAKVTKEKEYLQANAMQKNKDRRVQQRHKNNNNNSNYNKTTTTSSHKQQLNTLSDKAMMVTKAYAGVMDVGLPMRVKNDLNKVGDINETCRNCTQTTTTTTTTTTTQYTVQTDLTSNGSTTIADSNGGGVAAADAVMSAKQQPAKTKMYLVNGFLNPFGQLVALFGNDQLHLQDYTFFFNAERHTVFQLHTAITATTTTTTTTITTSNNNNINNNVNQKASSSAQPSSLASSMPGGSGRVLYEVTDSLAVNAPAAGTPAATTNPVAATSSATTFHSSPIKVEEVQLYNGKSLRQSRFNPFHPTRILIHGWLGGANAGVFHTLVPAYLRQAAGNYNVFTVDWGRGALADYFTASYRVKPVGKVVAKFIDFLQREAGIRYEDLHVIGFSMGAHIAGIAGKHVQTGRLPVIYALDPAQPFFRYENFDERVAITDADYIEVIHTSVGSYGYDRPLGHVDFYVNYGSGQPGCFLNECSHLRAFQIFAESLESKGSFRAQGCDVKLWPDMIKHRRCLMGTGRQLALGGDPMNVTALRGRGGVFYLATNAVPPYAKDVS